MIFFLGNSKKSGKRYYVRELTTNRTVHFGDVHYENYLIHQDDNRKRAYRKRHINDNIKDPFSAGFWSYNLLWNKPYLSQSIDDIKKRFDISVRVLKNFSL